MVSLALIFTPVFTLGLGDVPPHLYAHGSSLFGALQQVAGALGTAVVATLLTWRTTALLEQGDSPLEAQVGGMTAGFWFGVALTAVVLGLLFRLPNRPSPAEPRRAPTSRPPRPPRPDTPARSARMCPVEGATVAGVPTYRACLVDVFDTAISIDMPRYNAALAREATVDPGAFGAAFRQWAVPVMEGTSSIREAMAGVLEACGVAADEDRLDRMVAADRELVDELAVLHEDVVPFLESLRERGVRTAFVSNCAENTRPLLGRLGLDALVDELVLSCEVRAVKPDPAIFKVALERLGVRAGDALFVDDQAAFCRAAEAAGIRAVQIDRARGQGEVATLTELLVHL